MYVDYKAMGRRIAARRKELGYKQAQVNEMADLSDKYLSNLERATSVPSIDVLMKLCHVLQTTPDYLLLGATTEPHLSDSEQHIRQMVGKMTPQQAKLAVNFIDWLVTQDI